MARLPQVGGDSGSWGDILNDFLSVAHDDDGTLTADAIRNAGAYIKPLSGIGEADLDPAVVAQIQTPGPAGEAGDSVTVQLVPAALWPPAADPNPLHIYVKVPDA